MVTCRVEDACAALADELSGELESHEDWLPRLTDFGAPRWKLEQVQDQIGRLRAELVDALGFSVIDEDWQADELAELAMLEQHAGLWDV